MEKEKKKSQKLSKAAVKEIEEDVKKYLAEFKDLYEDSVKFIECTQKGATKNEGAALEAKKAREKAKWMSTHEGQSYDPEPDVVAKAKRYCQNDLSITEEQLQEIEKMLIGRKYHRPQPKDIYSHEISSSKIVGHEVIKCGTSEQGANDTYVGYLVYTQIKDTRSFKVIRYSEFKNFDKEVKKIKPPEAILPPPSSKFGKRNLSEDFISDRVEKLGAYLNEISSCEELNKTPIVLRFLSNSNTNNTQLEALDKAIHAMRRKYKIWCGDDLSPTQEEAIVREITKVIAKTRDLDIGAVARVVASCGGHSAAKELWEDLKSDKSMVLKHTEGILSIEYAAYKSNEYTLRQRFTELIKPAFEPIQDQLNTAIDLFIQNLVPPAFGGSNLGVDTLTTDFIRITNSAETTAVPVILNRSKDTRLKYLEFLSHNIFPEVTEIGNMLSRTLTCDFFKESSTVSVVGGELSNFFSEIFTLMKAEFWGEPLRIIFSFKESLSRVDTASATNIDGVINKGLRELKDAISDAEFQYCAEAKRVWWTLSKPPIPPEIASVLAPLSITTADYIRNEFMVHVLMRFWNVFTDTAWGMFYDKSEEIPWAKKVDIAYEKGAKAFYNSIKSRFTKGICNIVSNLFKLSIIGPLFNETFEKSLGGPISDITKECIDSKTMAAFGVRSLFYSVLDEVVMEYCLECANKKKELIESSAYNLFSGIPPSTMSMPSH